MGEGRLEAGPFGFGAGQAEAQAGRRLEEAGQDGLLGQAGVDGRRVGQRAPLEQRGAAAAGKAVALKPGGLHVMLMDLKKPLESGSKFPLTLKFERAGEVTVEVDVQPNPPAPGDHGHEHGATTE